MPVPLVKEIEQIFKCLVLDVDIFVISLKLVLVKQASIQVRNLAISAFKFGEAFFTWRIETTVEQIRRDGYLDDEDCTLQIKTGGRPEKHNEKLQKRLEDDVMKDFAPHGQEGKPGGAEAPDHGGEPSLSEPSKHGPDGQTPGNETPGKHGPDGQVPGQNAPGDEPPTKST